MKKRVIIILILIAIISITIYLFFNNYKKQDAKIYSGNIEATTTDLSFQAMGKLIELKFDEGENVNKKDLIGQLDEAEFVAQKDAAQAKLQAAKARISQLNTSIELQKRTTNGQIKQAKANLYTVQANLNALKAGSRSQDIEQTRQTLKTAMVKKENALKDFNRVKSLFEKGVMSQKNLDDVSAALDIATADVNRLQQVLNLVKEGPRIEDIEAAKGRVAQAEAALETALAGPLSVKNLVQQLETANLDIKNAQAMVRLYDTQLAKTKLYSLINGIVISKNAEPGEVLSPGAPVLTLADLDNIWLKIYIDTADLGKVKLGQKIKIKTDSFPDKFYEGNISFISSEAEFTPKMIQTPKERVKQVYRVKIKIKNENQELKPGMPADAYLML